VYGCTGHKEVADDVIALNGLQRKATQVTLQQELSIQAYKPDPQSALVSLTVAVDFLAKPKEKVQPKPVNTDDLAKEFKANFVNHMFMEGQVVALEFDGLKLELTVTSFERINVAEKKVRDEHLGQVLVPTAIMFQKAKGASYITLEGNAVSGGGAANLFTKEFDFAKLGIGGLDAEFNHIFRRAFASRIWPSHTMKQMGINHVRGMLLFGPPGCGT
jgi:vesicle-fusing ATPase